MAAYFFDTSALVKRYARETGTAWMVGLFRHARLHRFYAARITQVETVAALSRKRRNAQLSVAESTRSNARLRREFDNRFVIVELTPTLAEAVVLLADCYYLRSYDAVQLAAALEANNTRTSLGLSPLIFVTADKDLLAAGTAEGLSLDNPSDH